MTITAIPTRYDGYTFRSRLEARWAVFFDVLHIPWEYEPEGYQTSAGWYVPDFRLDIPQIKRYGHQWFEVKRENAPEDPRHAALAAELGEPLIVARGLPRSYAHQLRDSDDTVAVLTRALSRGRDARWRSPLTAYGVQGAGPWPVAFADATFGGRGPHALGYCGLGDNRHWCQEDFTDTLQDETCHLAIFGWHPASEYRDAYMTYTPGFCRNIDSAYAVAERANFYRGVV